MALVVEQLPIRVPTPEGWLAAVLDNFDAFLIDHAACERKAAALAMSLVTKYADRNYLVEPMISLAREELAHFHEVYRILQKRGLMLGPDEKDPYVTALLKHVRHGKEEHFLDRLLVSGIVEARGCERFFLVGEGLGENHELGAYYCKLGREEAGHHKIFGRIAKHYFPEDMIANRLDELLDYEAEAMLAVPFRAAVH